MCCALLNCGSNLPWHPTPGRTDMDLKLELRLHLVAAGWRPSNIRGTQPTRAQDPNQFRHAKSSFSPFWRINRRIEVTSAGDGTRPLAGQAGPRPADPAGAMPGAEVTSGHESLLAWLAAQASCLDTRETRPPGLADPAGALRSRSEELQLIIAGQAAGAGLAPQHQNEKVKSERRPAPASGPAW